MNSENWGTYRFCILESGIVSWSWILKFWYISKTWILKTEILMYFRNLNFEIPVCVRNLDAETLMHYWNLDFESLVGMVVRVAACHTLILWHIRDSVFQLSHVVVLRVIRQGHGNGPQTGKRKPLQGNVVPASGLWTGLGVIVARAAASGLRTGFGAMAALSPCCLQCISLPQPRHQSTSSTPIEWRLREKYARVLKIKNCFGWSTAPSAKKKITLGGVLVTLKNS